jgi:hypothetical protein
VFPIRAVILAIVFGFLSSALAFSARYGQFRGGEAHCAAYQVDSSAACPVAFGLPRSSSLARFIPWKARPKIVLAETDQQFADDVDFGPALAPNGHNSPVSIAASTPRFLTLSPLRC